MKYRWWKSKHRWVYLKLAIKFFISPKRIQLIAHGISSSRNRKLLKELKECGVIKKE